MFGPNPILTSLSPNTEPDDIRLAWRTLLSPRAWPRAGEADIAVAADLAARLQQSHVTLTSSGRAALYEGLHAAGIGPGDEVIIQAFTCLAVPSAVIWAGATPIYADIDRQTFNLSAARVRPLITKQTRAIIIQHTFGIPAPLPEIIALAREHNLLIIEDLAHSLGGMYNGQPLGSFGDLAILSFGRDKTISSVFGGALATNVTSLHDTVKKNMASYQAPPRWWVIQQLLHPILVNSFIPLYFTAHLGKILLVVAQRFGLLSMAVTRHEKAGAKPDFLTYIFSPALLPLLAQQLKKLDRYTAHRRRIAARYISALPVSFKDTPEVSGSNWLRFPLLVLKRDELLKAARRQHIILGDWYATPISPVPLHNNVLTQYKPGSCPIAEEVSKQCINLPTHPRLTDLDADRIIACVKPFI